MAKSDIRLRILGENKTGAAFNKFKKDINSTQVALNNLRNQIIAAFGVRELVRAGDTFVNIQNRMQALTGSAADTASAMAHMKRIAGESRSDFDAIGTLFTRLTIATQELGVSQNDIAKATQTVANTFVIAGAESSEAANSARQLAQGLASGALRGDELRSVMENNVILSNLLSKGLGITTGQLKDFGSAGKLTAEAILPILIKATEETTKTVADMDMTIGQAILALKTQFTTLVGEFNNSTNAFGSVANGINFIAQNMELLIIPITALTVSAIPGMIIALNTLKVAILTNPIGLLATGFAALVSVLMIANKNSKEYGTTLDDLTSARAEQVTKLEKAETAYARFKALEYDIDRKAAQKNIDEIDALILAKTEQAEIEKKLQTSLDNLGTTTVTAMQESIQITKDFADTVEGQLTNAFKTFFDFTSKQFLDFKNLATSVARAIINELINVFIVQKAVGMVKGKISDMQAALDGTGGAAGALTSFVNDYAGGGYTGNRARAGGVDGKGGFPAILHPKETVVDHAQGQGMGATVNFNISTVDAAGFDELLASRKGLITSIINNAMNNRGRMGVT